MIGSRSSLLRGTLAVALALGILALLYYGRSVLVPLTIAGLLALLLRPVERWVVAQGLPRWAGIAASMAILLAILTGLVLVVGDQATRFAQRWPQVEQEISSKIRELQQEFPSLTRTIQETAEASGGGSDGGSSPAGAEASPSGNPASREAGEAGSVRPEARSGSGGAQSEAESWFRMAARAGGAGPLAGVLSATMQALTGTLVALVFVVLFLSQGPRLRQFALRVVPGEQQENTADALDSIGEVAQKYLVGRLVLVGVLFVLYSIGFVVSGLEYALFVALLAAVLSIIPYVGNVIGGGIALAIALVAGGDGNTTLWGVLVTMVIAQLLENYVLTPMIVGDEVSLNPLAVILGVWVFTVLWGPVGAIVAIPIIATVRVVSQHVERWAPLAYLLGDEPQRQAG